MDLESLEQASDGIERADSLTALGAALAEAARPLGAHYFQLARFAPLDVVTPRFEPLVERMPDGLNIGRFAAENPDFHRDLLQLFENEKPFDSERDAAWRVRERKALVGDALTQAGVAHYIVAPRFGARGLLGYAILLAPEVVTSRIACGVLALLGWSAVKRALDLTRAVSGVARSPLTPRQMEALRFCAQGKSDWDIAQLMGVSPATVHDHIESAKRRIGVKTRVQAVAKALQVGWLAA